MVSATSSWPPSRPEAAALGGRGRVAGPVPCFGDDTFARLVDGEIDDATRERVDRHLVDCPSCRALLAAFGRRFSEPPLDESTEPAGRSFVRTELVEGERIARFEVRERLGSGGMGVVYRAHDPELDRDVALKLLRVDASAPLVDLEARHRREAQAMARLSHPNVVMVFDVGVDQGRVFIASEYIQGATLQAWLEQSERPWSAIVDMFIAAGRGLCAAHDAGLVHRDFKPSNVMVGEEGRICVVDFGLASSGSHQHAKVEVVRPGLMSESEVETTALTRTGTILGTPAFLAPECFEGHGATQAADQFSFCVALYRAVYGVAPFGDGSVDDRQQRARQARLAPGSRRVPAWLGRALRRGLAFLPEDRHPNLGALLAHLQAGRTRGRRALWLGSWAATLAVALGVGYVAWAPAAPVHALCEDQDSLAGVWDRDLRDRMDQAASAAEADYVAEAWGVARGHLDAYAQDFEASRTRACAASDSAHASAWLDCLARRRAGLVALVDLLVEDRELLAQASEFVADLDSLSSCEAAIVEHSPEPVSSELSALLERAELLRVAGRYEQARELGLTVAEQARTEGAAETRALALVVRGRALASLGEAEEAIRTLDEAARVGLTHERPRPVLEAWIALVKIEGLDAARPAQAERWAVLAEALLDAQPSQPRLEAGLATNLGLVHANMGRFDRAIAQHEHALERLGDDPRLDVDRLEALSNLAGAILGSGDLEGAERRHLEVIELAERTLGSGHPHVGTLWNNLAAVYARRRQWSEAQAAAQRSIEIKQAALGPTHPSVLKTLCGLAAILTQLGEFEETIDVLEEALPKLAESRGPTHPVLRMPMLQLAQAYQSAGRFDDAFRLVEQAEANVLENLGTSHPSYAEFLQVRGRLHWKAGRHGEGLADFHRALELYTQLLGPEYREVEVLRLMIGELELELGHRDVARAWIEPLVPEHGELSSWQAQAAFDLARSLPAAERAQARLLAERAREVLRSQGARPATLARIEAYLAEDQAKTH